MFVEYVDHVFVKGFGAAYQHNALFAASSWQDSGHFFPHQLLVHMAMTHLIPVSDLSWVAGEGSRGRGTEDVGDGEVPEAPEVVELLFQQDVVLRPAGVQAVDDGVLNVALHNGMCHLHHRRYASAAGEHPNAMKL